jgi:hypothetical protein
LLLGQLDFSVFMAIANRAGEWVAVAALPVAGFALALVFSAVYDGPLALSRLLLHGRSGQVGPHARRSTD